MCVGILLLKVINYDCIISKGAREAILVECFYLFRDKI